jgi:hypothetical protein
MHICNKVLNGLKGENISSWRAAQADKGRTGASFIVPVKREQRIIFRERNVEGGQ